MTNGTDSYKLELQSFFQMTLINSYKMLYFTMGPIFKSLGTIIFIIATVCISAYGKPFEKDSIGFPDVAQSVGSPVAITRIGDSPYTIYRQSATWFRASEVCASHNRILATFKKDEDYNSTVLNLYEISTQNASQSEFRINRRYWIGLNDLEKHGLWRWNKNFQPALLNKWTKGEKPSVKSNESHCVIMWNPLRKIHTWKEEICSNKYYFICEDYENPART